MILDQESPRPTHREAAQRLADIEAAEWAEIRPIKERYASAIAAQVAAIDKTYPHCARARCGHLASIHTEDGCMSSCCNNLGHGCDCECEEYTDTEED